MSEPPIDTTLIEKLKALKPDFGDMGPGPETVAYMDAIDDCINIIRQHQPAPDVVERSWQEDLGNENGSYNCRCSVCGMHFTGHKRRVVCKVCAKPSEIWVPIEHYIYDKIEDMMAEFGDDPKQCLEIIGEYIALARHNNLKVATRKPVSVSLEKCVAALDAVAGEKWDGNICYEPHEFCKAVLDAAGVKYV